MQVSPNQIASLLFMSALRKSRVITLCRHTLLTCGLIVASIVVSFGLLEIFARVKFSDEVGNAALHDRLKNTMVGAFIQPSAIPGLLYELKPEISVEWQGVTVATSRDSCRIQTLAELEPPPCVGSPLRIAVMGDSTSFGWRVEYEETYGEILREKIEKEIREPVIIKNFSVPGYNSLQHYIVFRERVIPWQPDITILHYDHNDADPITFKPPSYLSPDYGDNFLHSALVKLFLRRMRYAINKQAATSRSITGKQDELFVENYRYSGAQYDEHLKHFFDISELSKKHNIPVVCYIFNTFLKRQSDWTQDKNFTLLHGPKANKLAEYGFVVVDSYGPIQHILNEKKWDDLRETWISKDDAHPKPEGHLLIADIIFNAIKNSPKLKRAMQ